MALVIRILLVILLAAVLAGTVSWVLLPYIASSILSRTLESSEWKLDKLMLQRPVGLNLRLRELRVVDQAGTTSLEATGMVLRPASTSLTDLAVNIDHLIITATGDDEQSPIELQSLLGTYLSVLPQAIHQGKIEALKLCVPALPSCTVATLTWWHDNDGLQARIEDSKHRPGRYLHVGMTSHSATVELYQSGPKAVVADLQLTWPDMKVLHLDGSLLSTDDITLTSALTAIPDAASIDLHAFSATFNLQLPLGTIRQLADLTDRISGHASVEALGNFKWDADGTMLELNQPLAANVIVASNEVTVHVLPNTRVNTLIQDVANGVVTNQQDVICQYRISMYRLICMSNDLTITANHLITPVAATLLIPDFYLEIHKQAGISGDAQIQLEVSDEGQPRLNASGRVTFKDDVIALASSSLVVDGVTIEAFQAAHSLKSKSGDLKGRYSGNISALTQWTDSPLSGDLVVEQEAEWQGNFDPDWQHWPVTLRTRLSGSNLAGEIDGYEFRGGELTLAMAGWLPFTTSEPVRMSWQEIDVGFPMQHTDLSFNLSLNPDSRVINVQGISLQSELLGGTVKSNDYAYDSDSGDGYLMLDLENLDLLEVLALEQEDFHAEGKLNGRLPVNIVKNQLTIEEGAIEALAPGGLIQYRPSDSVTRLAESNPQMALVVDTLKNFRYDTLSSRVDFGADGILHLSTSLAGNNPDVEGGRRINFNLDVEENIAALLESLRFNEGITNRVDERYKN